MNKNTVEQLEKLWERVPDLSLGHLISLSVREEDTLYQLPDDVLINKISRFVTAMEYQKNSKEKK